MANTTLSWRTPRPSCAVLQPTLRQPFPQTLSGRKPLTYSDIVVGQVYYLPASRYIDKSSMLKTNFNYREEAYEHPVVVVHKAKRQGSPYVVFMVCTSFQKQGLDKKYHLGAREQRTWWYQIKHKDAVPTMHDPHELRTAQDSDDLPYPTYVRHGESFEIEAENLSMFRQDGKIYRTKLESSAILMLQAKANVIVPSQQKPPSPRPQFLGPSAALFTSARKSPPK